MDNKYDGDVNVEDIAGGPALGVLAVTNECARHNESGMDDIVEQTVD